MDFTTLENTPQLQVLTAEKLAEKADKILKSISSGQVLCIHVGKRSKVGGYLIDPRVDNEGLPALQVFLRSNLADAKISGWEEYQALTKLPDLENNHQSVEALVAESAQGNDSASDEAAKPASGTKKTTKQ